MDIVHVSHCVVRILTSAHDMCIHPHTAHCTLWALYSTCCVLCMISFVTVMQFISD